MSVGSSPFNAALAAATPNPVAVCFANDPRKRPCTVRLAETIQMGLVVLMGQKGGGS